MHNGVLGHCVYIDETGYNIWTRRSQGRAPRGIPARRVVHAQRGHNCNVTFAISGKVGLVHHQISFQTVTRERFEGFLADTVRECEDLLPENEAVYLIYDNARPHVNAPLPEGPNPLITVKLLPPYSPFLNSTEMAHSAFKAAVKRMLAPPEWQRRVRNVQEAAHRAGMKMHQWRCNILQEAPVGSLPVDAITPAKCTRWCNQCKTYMYMH